MAGWFSRVLQGNEPAEAEPVEFSLTCRCGNTVTGIRGQRMHVAVCRECRYQICVLPVSPYPRPKVRTPKKKVPKPASRRDVAGEDVRTPPPIPKRASRRDGEARPSEPAPKKSTRIEPKSSQAAPREPQFTAPRRRIVTPLRLIAVGMLGVVTLAGWWVGHRRAVGQAVVTFAEAAKAGRAALAESDFGSADLQLRRAVTALELLGRDDREARQVRQLAREAAAAHGLALSSLFELISETRGAQKISPNNWQQTIKQSYQGRWFLLETNGLQFTTGDPPQWRFSVPLIPGTEPLQISGDLATWSRLFGSTPPTHVIIAGQLDEIRSLGNGTDQGLEIVLKKESLCLWTNAEVYSVLGGTLDEGSLTTLKAQAQLLGISE
ncbi:MAG: hypothetical protein JWN70_5111 [Planctomycetaceae bacterium]|nr:hypothetical protein [Planctomycetaceae bacterium]